MFGKLFIGTNIAFQNESLGYELKLHCVLSLNTFQYDREYRRA